MERTSRRFYLVKGTTVKTNTFLAHNPKVDSSNLSPATKFIRAFGTSEGFFVVYLYHRLPLSKAGTVGRDAMLYTGNRRGIDYGSAQT